MLNSEIVARHDINPNLIILKVRRTVEFQDFLPGQYTTLGITGSTPRPASFPPETTPPPPDKLIKRAYSICSAPSDKGSVEFCLSILPEGVFTSRIISLQVGAPIFLAPKIVGSFTLTPVPADSNLILIATGTGIAPYISMLREPSTWSTGRKITVIHGTRYVNDLAYCEELSALATNHPLTYYPIVSREDWSGKRGHVQSLLKDGTVSCNPAGTHVFICGNPAMIDEVEILLHTKGFTTHSKKTPGNIHHEKYW